MSAPNDLTTVARVRRYLGSSDPDPRLTSEFITGASLTLLTELNRDTILVRTYTDVYDGTGTRVLTLRRFPVLQIMSIAINGVTVPANTNPPLGSGYTFDGWDGVPPGNPQSITLQGWCFSKGKANVYVTYKAGYGTLNEFATIPANPFNITPLGTEGLVTQDLGVTFTDAAMTPLVAVKASPVAGQYIAPTPLDPYNPFDFYTFAAADTGKSVFLNYGYVPHSLERAACQVASEQLTYRTRIGEKSKTLGGQETIVYELSALPQYVKMGVQGFKSVVPLA